MCVDNLSVHLHRIHLHLLLQQQVCLLLLSLHPICIASRRSARHNQNDSNNEENQSEDEPDYCEEQEYPEQKKDDANDNSRDSSHGRAMSGASR